MQAIQVRDPFLVQVQLVILKLRDKEGCNASTFGQALTDPHECRGAELLYRTGLGLMALDSCTVVEGSDMREVELADATMLLLNLAQALLKMPAKQRRPELAVLEAAMVSFSIFPLQ